MIHFSNKAQARVILVLTVKCRFQRMFKNDFIFVFYLCLRMEVYICKWESWYYFEWALKNHYSLWPSSSDLTNVSISTYLDRHFFRHEMPLTESNKSIFWITRSPSTLKAFSSMFQQIAYMSPVTCRADESHNGGSLNVHRMADIRKRGNDKRRWGFGATGTLQPCAYIWADTTFLENSWA